MPVESAADLESFFDEEEFAEAASYLEPGPGADPVPCRVIMDRGQGRENFSAGGGEMTGSERHLWVPVTSESDDVAVAFVERGGLFTVTASGEVFEVTGQPKLEQTGRLWSAQLLIVD